MRAQPDDEPRMQVWAISGIPGVGKTALAVEWAHQIAADFPDGQLYLNLRGFGPSGDLVPVPDAILGFLGSLAWRARCRCRLIRSAPTRPGNC
ncbi:MAG TPA: hypothetical protein VNF47_01915 [Streptosporangiaceae bacterium]|nr:hypothetical protein [Streptosporangiaceae bacterium]